MRRRLRTEPLQMSRRVLHDLLKSANVGLRYWDALLEDIPDDIAHKTLVRDYINDYSQHEYEGVGLLLHGNHGSGKTTILSILLREAIRRGPCSAWFMPSPEVDWYARHRDASDASGTVVWKRITGSQIVTIDDIGSERQAEWNDCWLEEVIRLRYNERLATHIATNLPLDVLFGRYSWLRSIAKDAFLDIEITGEMR